MDHHKTSRDSWKEKGRSKGEGEKRGVGRGNGVKHLFIPLSNLAVLSPFRFSLTWIMITNLDKWTIEKWEYLDWEEKRRKVKDKIYLESILHIDKMTKKGIMIIENELHLTANDDEWIETEKTTSTTVFQSTITSFHSIIYIIPSFAYHTHNYVPINPIKSLPSIQSVKLIPEYKRGM